MLKKSVNLAYFSILRVELFSNFSITENSLKNRLQLTFPILITLLVIHVFTVILPQAVQSEISDFKHKLRVDDTIRGLQLPMRVNWRRMEELHASDNVVNQLKVQKWLGKHNHLMLSQSITESLNIQSRFISWFSKISANIWRERSSTFYRTLFSIHLAVNLSSSTQSANKVLFRWWRHKTSPDARAVCLSSLSTPPSTVAEGLLALWSSSSRLCCLWTNRWGWRLAGRRFLRNKLTAEEIEFCIRTLSCCMFKNGSLMKKKHWETQGCSTLELYFFIIFNIFISFCFLLLFFSF